jgi:hypothetical protein
MKFNSIAPFNILKEVEFLVSPYKAKSGVSPIKAVICGL